MQQSHVPSMYPEARSQAQSHLFALTELANREINGFRVPGVSADACAPRHRAVGVLEHLLVQERETTLPPSLKDRLAEVFIESMLSPRSDMDYLLSLRGLSMINPKGPQSTTPTDLAVTVNLMLQEKRTRDVELGIFMGPVHAKTCDFLVTYQKEAVDSHVTKIEAALRAYLDLWPAVPRSSSEAPLHPVFYPVVNRDLAAIRSSMSLSPLKPPKGW